MKHFPPDRPGAKGALVNEIRARIRSVGGVANIQLLKETFGEPDRVNSGLSNWLPNSTAKAMHNLDSLFFDDKPPVVEQTWIYTNPYLNNIQHCFGIRGDTLVAVWEVNGNSIKVYDFSVQSGGSGF